MKTIKSFRLITVSLLTMSVMLIALACGGDDDDDDSNGGTGGDKAETGGSGGSDSGNGGGNTNGGSGGSMDAGQADGMADPLPTDVAEGGECTMSAALFSSTGKCQSASADCEGGLPTQFDLSGLTGIDPMVSTFVPTPTSDQANCASGLICCVDTTQCASAADQINGNDFVSTVLQGTVSTVCGSPGSCAATDDGYAYGEVTVGCPSGETCCVNVPPLALPEGGLLPPATDAGEQP